MDDGWIMDGWLDDGWMNLTQVGLEPESTPVPWPWRGCGGILLIDSRWFHCPPQSGEHVLILHLQWEGAFSP